VSAMVVTGMVVATVVVGATTEVGGIVDIATVTGVVAVVAVSANVVAAVSDAGDDPSASFGAPGPVHAPAAASEKRQIPITFSTDSRYPTPVRPAGNPGELARLSHVICAPDNGRRQSGAAISAERGPKMTASPVMYPVHSFTFQPGHSPLCMPVGDSSWTLRNDRYLSGATRSPHNVATGT